MPSAPFYTPGRYWGQIVDHGLAKTKTGKPQIVIRFVVMGAVNPLDPLGNILPVAQSYERSVYRVITANTEEWVLQDLEKLGFTGDRMSQLDLTNGDACDLRGKELAFSCKHEADLNNVLRERWSIANDKVPLSAKPLDPKELRQLDAMFGRSLKSAKKAAPATPTSPPSLPFPTPTAEPDPVYPDPNAQATREEIPF